MNHDKGLVNLKLVIEYDGKNYFGWQRQSAKPTIQHTIEKSLQVLFPGEKIQLAGAGRTDTGVHAMNQAANIKLGKGALARYSTKAGTAKQGVDKLAYSLNSILPDDILIKKISKVNGDFHARYSAKSRRYRYFITTQRHALDFDKLYFIKTKFDIDLAEKFCKLIQGAHSFKSLCKNKTDEHDFYCDVKSVSVKKLKEGIIRFEIEANRFLHSMVRAVIGAMLQAASGKMELSEFRKKFIKGEDIKIQYVPANALYLVKVNYN